MSIEDKKFVKYTLLGLLSLIIAAFIENDSVALVFYIIALFWLLWE